MSLFTILSSTIEFLIIIKRISKIAYNGVEVFVENFEVLEAKENKFTWEPASDGRIASGAVSTGREGNDEIYIGRAPYQGSMTVGKVRENRKSFFLEIPTSLWILNEFQIHPSHRCLYMPYGGHEVRLTSYEVLVYKKPNRNDKNKSKQDRRFWTQGFMGGF